MPFPGAATSSAIVAWSRRKEARQRAANQAVAASRRAAVDLELARLGAELDRGTADRQAALDREMAVLRSGLQSESRRLQAELQRLRSSYLKSAAGALLLPPGAGDSSVEPHRKRCMGHAEFLERWEAREGYEEWHAKLESLKSFLHEFNPRRNPIGWLRLVGYGHVCKWFFDREASRAVEDDEWRRHFIVGLDVERLIMAAKDEHLDAARAHYPAYFDRIIEDAL